MRRLWGLLPLLVLTVAIPVSAIIGLSLGQGDTTGGRLADELGCTHISSSHPQVGVVEETCSYRGDTIEILTLSKGPHALGPPDLLDNYLVAPQRKPVVIGCETRDVCVDLKRRLGGDLSSGPILGLSITIG